jgi:hypothetical protein
LAAGCFLSLAFGVLPYDGAFTVFAFSSAVIVASLCFALVISRSGSVMKMKMKMEVEVDMVVELEVEVEEQVKVQVNG